MRPAGYLRWAGPADLDCLRPLRWLCRDCDASEARKCGGYRESSCAPCAGRYRRRVRAVALSGMGMDRGRARYLYLLTLTAPGAAEHGQKRDGTWCPCTPPGGVDLASWNCGHSGRWNHFRTVVKRDNPGLEFFRGVEVQKRGALHDHAMIDSPHPLSKAVLRALAIACGYGHEVDLAPCDPGSKRAAYYVSKYVTKATDSRQVVPWLGETVNVETGEVFTGLVPGRYRTWSMSRGWGVTMASVRAEAAVYARGKAAEQAAARTDAALAALVGGGLVLDADSVADPPI